jgi:hypothetical protein
VAAVGIEQSRMQQETGLGQCGVFNLYMPNWLIGQDRPERVVSDCGAEGRGFEPRRSPSCLQEKRGYRSSYLKTVAAVGLQEGDLRKP